MLTQYAKSKGYKISMYTKTQFLESVMRKYGFRDWDSVLAAIGHGGLKEGQVFNKLLEAYEKENQKNLTDEQVLEAAGEQQEKLHVTKNKGGIIVKGIHDVAVVSPNAAVRFRVMRSLVLLHEDAESRSIEQIV